MSPFDSGKYEALLEGLDISVISLSRLENLFTLGAEYYAPVFLSSQARLHSSGLPLYRLRDCCSLITDGDHGSADYQEEGVLFVLSEAVNEGWIETEICRNISHSYHSNLPRSSLKPGDILVTKTGVYFGRSAVVPDGFPEANTIAHVGILRLKKKEILPHFLSTFFNSRYGYSQLRRRGLKATRPEIKLIEFDDIEIPQVSDDLQKAVQGTVQSGLKWFDDFRSTIRSAEKRLLTNVGLDNWQPPEPLAYIGSLSLALTENRLDAEHFQPKYQAMLNRIRSYAVRCRTINDFAERCGRGEQPKYFEDGTLAVVTSQHILENGLDYEGFERTDETYWEHKDFISAQIQRSDILTYMTGANVGRTAAYLAGDRALASNEVNILRLREENPIYVSVAMNSMIGRWQTRMSVTGSAQVHLYPQDIRRFVIPFVDEGSERAIVDAVMKAYSSRRKAHRLLESAKRSVEIAIEESEEKALAFLREVDAGD